MRSILILLLAALLLGSPAAGARPVWQPGTKGLANAVERALIGKKGGELIAAKLVKDPDPAIMRGFQKVIAAAGTTANAAKRPGIPPGIADGIGRLVDLHGEAAAKQFLKDVDALYDWAKAADAAAGAAGSVNMRMLGEMARKFSVKDYNNWKGAWFELQLTSSYAKAGLLRRLQPQAPPFDKSFRDAGIEYNNIQAYIEAKNWEKTARGSAEQVDNAARKLADQLDSHFERLSLSGRPDLVGFPPTGNIPNVPPGLKLVYDFSEAMPAKWAEALKEKAVLSLQQHFGVSKQTARNWADNHLHFRVCTPTPFNCVVQ